MTYATQEFLERTLPVVQRNFDLRPASLAKPEIFERPFADVTEVRGRINRTEKEIMEEIENGHLPWAFNFATSGDRNFLRLYKPAVEYWVDPRTPIPETLDELLRKLFPSASFRAGMVETISGRVFQEIFNLSADNMTALLKAGKILARDDRWGNGVTPLIVLPSVVGFLQARRLS